MQKSLFKSSTFWIGFTILTCVGGFFGSKQLFKTLPLVSVDISTDRQEAFNTARSIAKKHQWLSEKIRETAAFETDTTTQFFVELEGGGIKAFKKIITDRLYAPYFWHIRYFKEGVTNEAHIYLTPSGEPYGFELKIPEQEDSYSNVSVFEARTLATQTAIANWNVDLNSYEEIEASKTTTPNGRIDHTFVYERNDASIEDGRYRIKFVVKGDQVTQVQPHIHIPEGFKRRFEKMRSENMTLYSVFSTIFKILYIFFGTIIGGFILLRRRRYLIKPALYTGIFLGVISLLASLNKIPLIWMHYNTAIPTNNFLYQIVLSWILGAITSALMYFILIGAAEGYDRLAFPEHIQFWKTWSKDAGGSLTILGQTVSAYGFLAFKLCFLSGTYYLFTHFFNWWCPSSMLLDPNILAQYAPWFSGFSVSITAGIFEEFAFRALPIAGSLLIGRYFKNEKLWFIIGLVLQAVIFGGVHVNYPQYPAYYRIVEIFIPYLLAGIIYVYFGLLTTIITHYLWDLLLTTLPVMISTAPGMIFQKIIVVFLALLPLLIVLIRSLQIGAWKDAPANTRNKKWVTSTANKVTQKIKTTLVILQPSQRNMILTLGFLSLGVCFFFGNFKNTQSIFKVSKQEAIATALDKWKNIKHSQQNWRITTKAESDVIKEPKYNTHTFVWRTQTKEIYQKLLGSYLSSNHWKVRFAAFDGDITQRSEEYTLFIDNQNKVFRIKETVPEDKSGASLLQAEARGIALETVHKEFNISLDTLKEISAIDTKRPKRKDWEFVFQDMSTQLIAGGQAHITVTIAGEKVIDYHRSIFMPEDWIRSEEERIQSLHLFKMVAFLLLIILIALATGFAGSSILQNFIVQHMSLFFLMYTLIATVNCWNIIPHLTFSFSTAQPFSSQMFMIITALLSSVVGIGMLCGFFGGHIHIITEQSRYKNILDAAISALGISWIGIAGITLAQMMLPQYTPLAGSIEYLNGKSPLLYTIGMSISNVLKYGILLTLLVNLISRITCQWKHSKLVGTVLIFLLSFSLVGIFSEYTIVTILGLSLLITFYTLISYYSFLVHDSATTIIFVGSITSAQLLYNGLLQPYQGALLHTTIAAILVLLFSILWYAKIATTKIR
jgi:hypothetical protein